MTYVSRAPSARYHDLVAKIKHLEPFEELSLLVQDPWAEGLFAVMVTSYNDESADRRSFVVSGLLGMHEEWVELGRLWEQKLVEHNLPEFHAATCEDRRTPFEGYERFMREIFQREFYGLIAERRLFGFCTAVWQSAYAERWTEFEGFRSGTEGNFTHPYFLAFQHNIEAMCLRLDAEGVPKNEPVAFVFDRHKEYEGRAKVLYDSMTRGTGLSYKHRLGSITFGSRFAYLQLQAADVWAYESRKYVSDVLIDEKPNGERWQFKILGDTGRINISGFPPDSLDRLAAVMRDDLKEKEARRQEPIR